MSVAKVVSKAVGKVRKRLSRRHSIRLEKSMIPLGTVDHRNELAASLHDAALMTSKAKLKKLLHQGISIAIDHPNSLGQTALFCACAVSNDGTARLLLQHGADPNVKDRNGVTPVHAVCCTGNTELLCMLVAAGGDVCLKDNQGRGAVEWAGKNEDHRTRNETIDLLQQQITRCKSSGGGGERGMTSSINKADGDAHGSDTLSRSLKKMSFMKLRRKSAGSDVSLARHQSAGRGPVYGNAMREGCAIVSVVPHITENTLKECGKHGYPCSLDFVMTQMLWHVTEVSVKTAKPGLDSKDLVNVMMKEAAYLSKLRHPNVLTLMALCQSTVDRVALVMEMVQCNVYQCLHTDEMTFPPDLCVILGIQACSGMDYIHQQGFLHCAVSSHAVYLLADGVSVKLGNLEFMMDRSQAMKGHWSRVMSQKNAVELYPWMAPEVIGREAPAFGSDVYSFCCLLWEMCTGTIPWSWLPRQAVQQAALSVSGPPPLPMDGVPQEVQAILDKGLHAHQDCRHSFDNLYNLLKDVKQRYQLNQSHNSLPKDTSTSPGHSSSQDKSVAIPQDQLVFATRSLQRSQGRNYQSTPAIPTTTSTTNTNSGNTEDGYSSTCRRSFGFNKNCSEGDLLSCHKQQQQQQQETQTSPHPPSSPSSCLTAIKPASHHHHHPLPQPSPPKGSGAAASLLLTGYVGVGVKPQAASTTNTATTTVIRKKCMHYQTSEGSPLKHTPCTVRQLADDYQQVIVQHKLRQEILKGSMAPHGGWEALDSPLDSTRCHSLPSTIRELSKTWSPDEETGKSCGLSDLASVSGTPQQVKQTSTPLRRGLDRGASRAAGGAGGATATSLGGLGEFFRRQSCRRRQQPRNIQAFCDADGDCLDHDGGHDGKVKKPLEESLVSSCTKQKAADVLEEMKCPQSHWKQLVDVKQGVGGLEAEAEAAAAAVGGRGEQSMMGEEQSMMEEYQNMMREEQSMMGVSYHSPVIQIKTRSHFLADQMHHTMLHTEGEGEDQLDAARNLNLSRLCIDNDNNDIDDDYDEKKPQVTMNREEVEHLHTTQIIDDSTEGLCCNLCPQQLSPIGVDIPCESDGDGLVVVDMEDKNDAGDDLVDFVTRQKVDDLGIEEKEEVNGVVNVGGVSGCERPVKDSFWDATTDWSKVNEEVDDCVHVDDERVLQQRAETVRTVMGVCCSALGMVDGRDCPPDNDDEDNGNDEEDNCNDDDDNDVNGNDYVDEDVVKDVTFSIPTGLSLPDCPGSGDDDGDDKKKKRKSEASQDPSCTFTLDADDTEPDSWFPDGPVSQSASHQLEDNDDDDDVADDLKIKGTDQDRARNVDETQHDRHGNPRCLMMGQEEVVVAGVKELGEFDIQEFYIDDDLDTSESIQPVADMSSTQLTDTQNSPFPSPSRMTGDKVEERRADASSASPCLAPPAANAFTCEGIESVLAVINTPPTQPTPLPRTPPTPTSTRAHISDTSHHVSDTSRHMSDTSRYVLDTSHHMSDTSYHVSDTSCNVSDTSHHVSDTSHHDHMSNTSCHCLKTEDTTAVAMENIQQMSLGNVPDHSSKHSNDDDDHDYVDDDEQGNKDSQSTSSRSSNGGHADDHSAPRHFGVTKDRISTQCVCNTDQVEEEVNQEDKAGYVRDKISLFGGSLKTCSSDASGGGGDGDDGRSGSGGNGGGGSCVIAKTRTHSEHLYSVVEKREVLLCQHKAQSRCFHVCDEKVTVDVCSSSSNGGGGGGRGVGNSNDDACSGGAVSVDGGSNVNVSKDLKKKKKDAMETRVCETAGGKTRLIPKTRGKELKKSLMENIINGSRFLSLGSKVDGTTQTGSAGHEDGGRCGMNNGGRAVWEDDDEDDDDCVDSCKQYSLQDIEYDLCKDNVLLVGSGFHEKDVDADDDDGDEDVDSPKQHSLHERKDSRSGNNLLAAGRGFGFHGDESIIEDWTRTVGDGVSGGVRKGFDDGVSNRKTRDNVVGVDDIGGGDNDDDDDSNDWLRDRLRSVQEKIKRRRQRDVYTISSEEEVEDGDCQLQNPVTSTLAHEESCCSPWRNRRIRQRGGGCGEYDAWERHCLKDIEEDEYGDNNDDYLDTETNGDNNDDYLDIETNVQLDDFQRDAGVSQCNDHKYKTVSLSSSERLSLPGIDDRPTRSSFSKWSFMNKEEYLAARCHDGRDVSRGSGGGGSNVGGGGRGKDLNQFQQQRRHPAQSFEHDSCRSFGELESHRKSKSTERWGSQGSAYNRMNKSLSLGNFPGNNKSKRLSPSSLKLKRRFSSTSHRSHSRSEVNLCYPNEYDDERSQNANHSLVEEGEGEEVETESCLSGGKGGRNSSKRSNSSVTNGSSVRRNAACKSPQPQARPRSVGNVNYVRSNESRSTVRTVMFEDEADGLRQFSPASSASAVGHRQFGADDVGVGGGVLPSSRCQGIMMGRGEEWEEEGVDPLGGGVGGSQCYGGVGWRRIGEDYCEEEEEEEVEERRFGLSRNGGGKLDETFNVIGGRGGTSGNSDGMEVYGIDDVVDSGRLRMCGREDNMIVDDCTTLKKTYWCEKTDDEAGLKKKTEYGWNEKDGGVGGTTSAVWRKGALGEGVKGITTTRTRGDVADQQCLTLGLKHDQGDRGGCHQREGLCTIGDNVYTEVHRFYIPKSRWPDGCKTRLHVAVCPDQPGRQRVSTTATDPVSGRQEVWMDKTLDTDKLTSHLSID